MVCPHTIKYQDSMQGNYCTKCGMPEDEIKQEGKKNAKKEQKNRNKKQSARTDGAIPVDATFKPTAAKKVYAQVRA